MTDTLVEARRVVMARGWRSTLPQVLVVFVSLAICTCRPFARPPVVDSLIVNTGLFKTKLQTAGLQLDDVRREVREALREAGFAVPQREEPQSAGGYRITVSMVDVRQVHRAPLDGPTGAEESRSEVLVELRLVSLQTTEVTLRATAGWSELARFDEPAVAALRRAVRNASRRAAADLLLGVTESTKPDGEIVADLESVDSRVRDQAIQVLAERKNPKAVPALIARLRDPDPALVERAVGALAQIRDPRAVEPLIELSHRREGPFVAQIAWIIGDIGGADAEAYLLTLASGHPEALVRQAAKQALAQSRARRIAEPRSDRK